jgi:hypothetical protein
LETGRIDITDPELRRQLELTKEDMRFADHIVRLVVQDRTSNTFLDGVGWEGGDEWLRAEFKTYLLFMLRTSLMDGMSFLHLAAYISDIIAVVFKQMDASIWMNSIPLLSKHGKPRVTTRNGSKLHMEANIKQE